jgi:hypothetical protein
MAKRTVADQFVEILLAAGVQRMYGVVGDSLNPVVDAVRRHNGIDWVHVRHEEAGAFAAGAEAQLTGRLVACAGSCGPGNLHLINGLYDAHRSMAPVLALAAQIPSTEIGTGYFQETHPTLSFQECSHYCELVSRPEQLPRVAQIAIQQALGRGGVGVVALPGDVADQEASGAYLEHTYRLDQRPNARPSDQVLDELVGLVDGARRITLFCGRGAAGAHQEVLALAERLKAPVGHALRGKEWIQYDNPYDVGMSGLLGYGACYEAMHECDLLVLLGTDFPYVQFMLDFRTWPVVGGATWDRCSGPTRRDLNGCRQRWMRYLPQLCAGHEVEVVPPDGALQRGEDGGGVVVGALDEEGLAVAPEADRAGTGPRPELPSGCLEARSGLEAEASRIRDGAEHQVLGQLHGRCKRWGLVGGEVRAGELGRAALVGDARADHVLDPQAVDVDQPAAHAHPAVALLARDQHAHQALGAGVGGIDVGPLRVPLDGEPLAPPRAHPAPDELALRACLVGCGDGPDQGGDGCRRHAEGTGDLLGGIAACAQRAHAAHQVFAAHAGVILPTEPPDHRRAGHPQLRHGIGLRDLGAR